MFASTEHQVSAIMITLFFLLRMYVWKAMHTSRLVKKVNLKSIKTLILFRFAFKIIKSLVSPNQLKNFV